MKQNFLILVMALMHRPNPLGKILCWQGRHYVTEDDLEALADSNNGTYPMTCTRCNRKIILRVDPDNPGEYLTDEPNPVKRA